MSVIIETSIGDVTVDLYTDERPRCCLNFLKLCKIKYYNFSLFHTVQHDLVAQVGDPTASGRGGQSIFGHLYGEQARFFDMEVIPRILHSKKGLVSMVNNGSGMHGSQFYFTLADRLDYLDGKHTVFGEVAEGMNIIDKLNDTYCDENHRPHQDIRIYHTVILDDPYDDPKDLAVPSSSPLPTQEMLDSDRIPCDADINEDEGKTEEELAEMQAAREAKANTQILEMVGDLPEADVAPPENVLFVCKLNPVTTSDDLEIIFSRFGNIVSCEVIKDGKTGESLQYAFVEFENEDQCTNAYFKMDNVLIDDRRIHVDFSQSVSKLKWKGKGKGVEIQKGGDAPAFMLKNQERQSHGYDLVYAEDDLNLNTMASLKDKKPKRGHDKGRGETRDTRDKMNKRDCSEDDRQRGQYDKKGRKKDDRYDRLEDGRGRYDKMDRRKDYQTERNANKHRTSRKEDERRDGTSDSDQDRRKDYRTERNDNKRRTSRKEDERRDGTSDSDQDRRKDYRTERNDNKRRTSRKEDETRDAASDSNQDRRKDYRTERNDNKRRTSRKEDETRDAASDSDQDRRKDYRTERNDNKRRTSRKEDETRDAASDSDQDRRKDYKRERNANKRRTSRKEDETRDAASDSDQDRRKDYKTEKNANKRRTSRKEDETRDAASDSDQDRRKDYKTERNANKRRTSRKEDEARDAASDSDQDRRRSRDGRDHSEKKKRRQDSPDDSNSDEERQKKRKKDKKKKHIRSDDVEDKKSHMKKKKKRVENDSSEDERRRERKRERY